MNIAVNAAALVAAPSIAVGAETNAPLLRAEQMVKALRECYCGDGFELDEQASETMLSYFRRRDMWADESHLSDEELDEDSRTFQRDVVSFFTRYNQSLDWVVRGNPSVMICSCAGQSATALDLYAGDRDPIFDAIEDHKKAAATWRNWVDVHSDLDRDLPADKRQSSCTAWERKIVETDDPRWIEAETKLNDSGCAEIDAAVQLINVEPTTVAGAMALLRYVVEVEHDNPHCPWPDDLQDEDETRPHALSTDWSIFLHRNLAKVLGAASV